MIGWRSALGGNLTADDFIERWAKSGGSERANFQQFAIELTQLLGVPAPKPATADAQSDDYRFERPVTFIHTGVQSRGFIDLYRSGAFVMEAKQGIAEPAQADPDAQPSRLPDLAPKQRQGHGTRGTRRWDDTMLRARNQADGYARAVARSDGWPPFLIIVDVGHVIELYADFSGQGQGYTQYPDGTRYRIALNDLRDPKTLDRLRTIWTDPHSLDPSKISATVTREVADRLAALGRSFDGQDPQEVARFLMRCLFTMFAEDVRLIPENSFKALLQNLRGHPEHAAPALKALWETMNTGGFSPVLMTDLKRFNGGLFKDANALPLNEVQLSLLIDAASKDWKEVEPAIFGTLLERALSLKDRHKLGAHYTPRAYVERLVNPTVIEPLRADWLGVQGSAMILAGQGKLDEARAEVQAFHRRLCDIRVLDPACGSGNFLYVALELMKRLEGEVTALLADLGEDQVALSLEGHTVDPHQFLGIELNPWAAAVAELVLWIGYLQWHFRTHGQASPAEPVLRDFRNIENRDAVLDWEGRKERRDDQGQLVTRWDGESTILHNVTGERVPDPLARVQVWDYSKPRPAKWPDVDFIVGNPPFIGNKRMRDALGDGYTEALRKAYPKIPESADFVMFWWDKAAIAVRAYNPAKGKGARRFGLITTNSLRQTFNRRVLELHLADKKTPLYLTFAIPDHPWVDAGDGAAVRIAMTVAEAGRGSGLLLTVTAEEKRAIEADGRSVQLADQRGLIFADLRTGADIAGSKPLKANLGLAHQGVIPVGEGFRVSARQARELYSDAVAARVLRPYLNGKQFIDAAKPDYIVDFLGLSEQEALRRYPALYQLILDAVKPQRDNVNRQGHREKWWIFGEPRIKMRPALDSVARYVATCRTAKHRVFAFLESRILPDAKLVAISLDDGWQLAALSSKFHVDWAKASGGWLGVGNDSNYNHAQCFNLFPFPIPTDPQKARLRELGEQLDAHRKAQQAAHPKLTLTAMYNVLEKLRAGERIEGRDKETYDQGLVGILRDIHDKIDAEVAAAYGWPVDLTDDEILHRLVDLNRERAREEQQGLIRWLRPDYQNPRGKAAVAAGEQSDMDLGTAPSAAKTAWPKTLPEQMTAVQKALAGLGVATPDQVARQFSRGRAATVQPLLETLTALGQAHVIDNGRFAA